MFDRHHPANEEKQCRLETGQKIAPEATQIRSSIRFLILSLPYADRLERQGSCTQTVCWEKQGVKKEGRRKISFPFLINPVNKVRLLGLITSLRWFFALIKG
jgi:hypothetical protein